MSPYSCILDIETLATSPEAVITEIGVIAFDRSTFAELKDILITPNIITQLADRRVTSNDTMDYRRQKETLPKSIGIHTPKDTVEFLAQFLAHFKPEWVWIQGPDFDRPILENFICQYGGTGLPWDHWRTQDTRTAWNLAFPGVKHDPRPHTAIGDCRATLADLQKSLTALNRLQSA